MAAIGSYYERVLSSSCTSVQELGGDTQKGLGQKLKLPPSIVFSLETILQ